MSRYNVSGRCYLALIVGRVHPTPSSSLVTSQTTLRPCPFPFQSVSKGSIRGCKRPSFGFQALPLSWDLWSTGLDLASSSSSSLFLRSPSESRKYHVSMAKNGVFIYRLLHRGCVLFTCATDASSSFERLHRSETLARRLERESVARRA